MQTPAPHRDTLPAQAVWARNVVYLWDRRRILLRVALVALVLSTVFAFLIPKRYDSSTTIMPPEQTNTSAAMLAALTGRTGTGGGLSALAGGLLGVKSNGELFMDLLHSGTVRGRLIERFNLQQVYGKRYMTDTAKKLANSTDVAENKKSGVITVTVTDTDRQRAQSMAQAYVEELNNLLARVSTSSARRERIFVEQRLASVSKDLNDAQIKLSEFSSSTSTIDIKEQTRATVDAGARLQAQLIVSEGELESLKQIYGDDNVRVRSARERVGVLQRELNKIGGSSSPDASDDAKPGELYPPLRRLPALGVRWANLYRRVRVQETVYDLLTAEYETARIQEAKEIPTVSVIDAAGWPEKKSYPHRSYFILGGPLFAVCVASLFILLRRSWYELDDNNDLKLLAAHIKSPTESLPPTTTEPEVAHP